jgi:hypothetical protein
MANARIIFHGLCGFVPGGALAVSPLGWVGVFLVKADEEARVQFGRDLPPHYPFLRFRLNDLEGHENAPAADAYWQLGNEDLAIITGKAMDAGVTIPLGREDREAPNPNIPKDEEHFDWISMIDCVEPGAGRVNNACLLETPVGNRVAVRVHLTDGFLQTNEVNNYDGGAVVSQFDPFPGAGGRPVRHALASSSVLTIYGIPERLIIRSQRFGTKVRRDLRFRAGINPEIHIFNFCMSDLLNDPRRIPPVYPGPDFDYEWHYVLSQDADRIFDLGRIPVPVAVSFTPRDGSGGREPARCAEAAFAAPDATQVRTMTELAKSMKSVALEGSEERK